MNKHRATVTLRSNSSSSSRPIKAVALRAFKGVRWLGHQGAKTPERLAGVRRDIVEAWQESAKC